MAHTNVLELANRKNRASQIQKTPSAGGLPGNLVGKERVEAHLEPPCAGVWNDHVALQGKRVGREPPFQLVTLRKSKRPASPVATVAVDTFALSKKNKKKEKKKKKKQEKEKKKGKEKKRGKRKNKRER